MSKPKPRSKIFLFVLLSIGALLLLCLGYVTLVLPAQLRTEQQALTLRYEELKLVGGAAPTSKQWDQGSLLTVPRGWIYQYHVAGATAAALYTADSAIVTGRGYSLAGSDPKRFLAASSKQLDTTIELTYTDSSAGGVDVSAKIRRY